jgi:hypothetical protein
MKIKKHHQGTIGQWLSPFVIINLNDSVDLHDIIQIFQNSYTNPPEYCLFVGRYSTICKIIEKIKGLYNVEWIGDNYCIVSQKSRHGHYIPKAGITKASNLFLLELRGTTVLCVPELHTLNSLTGHPILKNINIIINFKPICNILYSDTDIRAKAQNIKEGSIQAIYIPLYQLEHLNRCLAITERRLYPSNIYTTLSARAFTKMPSDTM